MFSDQRVPGFGVIEVGGKGGARYSLPTAGAVAGLAGLSGKAAFMWICVAVGTLVERQAGITRLTLGIVGMALLALYGLMQPGKRIACFRVIELP